MEPNDPTPVFVYDDEPPTLAEVQQLLDGYVEIVRLPNGEQLLVNEEGRLRGMPENDVATLVARQPIYGPAVVLVGSARWK